MIKNSLKKNISKFLKKRGYALINLSNTFTTRKEFIYILLFTQLKKNIKIIQIGANDGKDLLNQFNNDYSDNINYVGIEPQQEPFNKLKETYKNFNNFILLQECVGIEGKSSFYYFNEKYKNMRDNFSDGTHSLVKENLIKRLKKFNLDPDIYINKYDVQVNPLTNIFQKYKLNMSEFKNLDLLQIDAEGYDDEVIYNSSIDFLKPKFINFEYKNLTKLKFENLIKYLERNFYECLTYRSNDCLAVLREFKN